MKLSDRVSGRSMSEQPPSELGAAFTGDVLARLPAADRARRRRRVLSAIRPTAAALAGALLITLLSLSTLPTHGAEGARTATRAVSWFVVGYSVWTNFAQSYLAFLGLTALPVVTAVLLLAAILLATVGGVFYAPRPEYLSWRPTPGHPGRTSRRMRLSGGVGLSAPAVPGGKQRE